MHKKHQNLILPVSFICSFLFLGWGSVHATGSIYFAGPEEITVDSGVTISVIIDADTRINALDLEISYEREKLKFLSFNNAGSIIDFWQAKPALIEEGRLHLSGGIMSGFAGAKGQIIKLSFTAIGSGTAKLDFVKKYIYLANGKGTEVVPNSNNFDLLIQAKGETEIVKETTEAEYPTDTTPPDVLLTLVKNPSDGNSLIVFNATDKESGIFDTEIRYKKWLAFSSWESASNPVLRPKGAWAIELKAKNNAGLENIKALNMPWRLISKVMIFFLLGGLVVLSFTLYNKYERKSRT